MTAARAVRVELGLLDHLQVRADDVQAVAAFYRDVLGAVVQTSSPQWAMVRLANVDIGIHAGEPGGGTAGGETAGGWVPGFRVHDIAALKAHLLDSGVEVTQDYHEIPGGVGLAFRDPAGNPLAAYQYGVAVEDLRAAGG